MVMFGTIRATLSFDDHRATFSLEKARPNHSLASRKTIKFVVALFFQQRQEAPVANNTRVSTRGTTLPPTHPTTKQNKYPPNTTKKGGNHALHHLQRHIHRSLLSRL